MTTYPDQLPITLLLTPFEFEVDGADPERPFDWPDTDAVTWRVRSSYGARLDWTTWTFPTHDDPIPTMTALTVMLVAHAGKPDSYPATCPNPNCRTGLVYPEWPDGAGSTRTGAPIRCQHDDCPYRSEHYSGGPDLIPDWPADRR